MKTNNVAFQWRDGHTIWKNSADTDKIYLTATLKPDGKVEEMYEDLDKYIEVDGWLVELAKNKVTNDIVCRCHENKVLYNERLDGPMLDKDVALNKYPECFI